MTNINRMSIYFKLPTDVVQKMYTMHEQDLISSLTEHGIDLVTIADYAYYTTNIDLLCLCGKLDRNTVLPNHNCTFQYALETLLRNTVMCIKACLDQDCTIEPGLDAIKPESYELIKKLSPGPDNTLYFLYILGIVCNYECICMCIIPYKHVHHGQCRHVVCFSCKKSIHHCPFCRNPTFKTKRYELGTLNPYILKLLQAVRLERRDEVIQILEEQDIDTKMIDSPYDFLSQIINTYTDIDPISVVEHILRARTINKMC